MLMNTAEYLSIIENIKSEITEAQYRAAVHVNADMLLLYDIGCVINEHKSWGHNIVLLELGTGFAFLGNQYHLNVGGDDFYIDLLFYNLNLRCYVVIELKTGDFKQEYAGQP